MPDQQKFLFFPELALLAEQMATTLVDESAEKSLSSEFSMSVLGQILLHV